MLDTSKSGACVLSSRDRLHSLAWHCDIVHILGWPAIDESEEFPMISPLVRSRRQPQENHGWLPTAKLRVSMPEPYHAISAQTSKHSLCSGFSIHFLYPFILSCLESRNFSHHLAPTNPAVPFWWSTSSEDPEGEAARVVASRKDGTSS